MQALFYIEPGKLEWRDATEPTVIESTDVIVRPAAVAACDLDRAITAGRSPFPGPFMLGHEFCGEVIAKGDDVTTVALGDTVIASFQPSCGTCRCCSHGHTSVCSNVPGTAMYGIGAAGGDWQGAIAEAIRVPWGDTNLRTVPNNIDPIAIASGSDNLADALRAVEEPLKIRPGSSFLAAGDGSIPLYSLLCAHHLGAEKITYVGKESFALQVADTLGVNVIEVKEWPKRFETHDITFDCTNDPEGLSAVIRSTAPYGFFTSGSIYFSDTTPIPLRDMYMKGITLNTGRVNSAAQLDRVLELVEAGLEPDRIKPAVTNWEDAIDALQDSPMSQKIILERYTSGRHETT